MNGQKMVLVGLVTLVLAMFLVAPSHAAPAWYTCTVNEAGPAGPATTTYAKLTDNGGSFQKKYVKLYPTAQKEMLAVMLTAIANDRAVLVYLDAGVSYPYVTNVYIKRDP